MFQNFKETRWDCTCWKDLYSIKRHINGLLAKIGIMNKDHNRFKTWRATEQKERQDCQHFHARQTDLMKQESSSCCCYFTCSHLLVSKFVVYNIHQLLKWSLWVQVYVFKCWLCVHILSTHLSLLPHLNSLHSLYFSG